MRLHDELYFEITVEGDRVDIDRFVSFVTSGELDDFFEITSDYIIYSDNYNAGEAHHVSVTLTNDDYGIEIDTINPEKFLDVLCSASRNVHLNGNLFDVDDEEYRFISPAGDVSYVNADEIEYNDELDAEAEREEFEENEDY